MLEYGYIVIGSGSSGSIVAGRLAAEGQMKVLLLEAGTSMKSYPQIQDPNQINCLYKIPEIHWGYESAPQMNLNKRVIYGGRS